MDTGAGGEPPPGKTSGKTPSSTEDTAYAQVVRSAGVVSLAVFLSRITGLVRETVFAGLFGAGMIYDAFVAAYRIPNLLRDLLAEGALSAAFVTTYSQTLATKGPEGANALSNRVATLIVPMVSVLCLVGGLLAPQLVRLIFPGYAEVEGKFELTVTMTRVLMPFLLFVTLAAKAMGVLNSRGRFAISGLASAFFNVTSVVLGLLFGFVLGPEVGLQPIVGMAIGTLLGGFVQYACQIPSLRATGLRFRPEFKPRDPAVRQVLRLMGPAAIGAGAVLINVMVNSVFASRLPGPSGEVLNGPVSWLGYSFRFMQLPLGLFGFAIATATLPVISRDAGQGLINDFRQTLSRSLGLVFLLTMPSTVGLFVLSEQIVGVVYQRGSFTAYDTEQTALALSFYCLGLVGYAGTKVLAPAFYALDDVWIPMSVSVASILLNFGCNKTFVDGFGFGHWSLALSTSLVANFNFVVLFAFMRDRVKGIQGRRLLASGFKIGGASLLMGAVCWYTGGAVETLFGAGTFIGRLASLLVSVPLGVGVLYGTCHAMGVTELELAQRAILARLSRGR